MPGFELIEEQYVDDAERALIEKATAGDGRAFETLMRPYLPRIKRKVRSYYKRDEDADDAMQELLLATFRRLHTFKFQSKFSSWLFRCTVNASLEHLQRRVMPHEHVSLDIEQSSEGNDVDMYSLITAIGEATYDTDPEAQLEAKQQLQLLDATLNKLPAAFRDAFWLREIEQLSYEEIAERMGCCDGTVKSRLNRARQAVCEVLGIERNHQ